MMKLKYKRFLCAFLACLTVLLFAGCGEYNSPLHRGEAETDAEGGQPSSDELRDDPTAFSVTLRYNGEQYKPRKKDEVKAQWTDGFTFYTADFGEDGVARVAGLDGDYKVTLHGLPEGYLYNPNVYTATNKSRNVIIDLYKPIRISGYGTGPFDCIQISKTGVYRVELTSAEHKVFFEYAPTSAGTYTVESWVSTAEGNYNPKVDVYNGSIAYKLFAYTLNDGGVCEGYTQNFKHTVEIADEQIGPNGQAVFTFAIHADSKNGVYPLYIDFAVQLNGSFELDHADKQIIVPTEVFTADSGKDLAAGYTFQWAESDKLGAENRPIFDGSMFKVWEKEDGGDGYYHVYDLTLYPNGYTETFADGTTKTYPAGYGPTLYAKISQAHRFTENPFTTIEDAGNSSLTVDGWANHKIFIEGIDGMLDNQLQINPQAAGPYFCLGTCPCRLSGKIDAEGHRHNYGVCPESCMECDADCRNLPDEWFDQIEVVEGSHTPVSEDRAVIRYVPDLSNATSDSFVWLSVPRALLGYATHCNSDGAYPVTPEIQNFLQRFSVSQRYFADGNGWVETHPDYKVDAKEDDQWLFACGYYVKN